MFADINLMSHLKIQKFNKKKKQYKYRSSDENELAQIQFRKIKSINCFRLQV